jgi:hypothetical protein
VLQYPLAERYCRAATTDKGDLFEIKARSSAEYGSCRATDGGVCRAD